MRQSILVIWNTNLDAKHSLSLFNLVGLISSSYINIKNNNIFITEPLHYILNNRWTFILPIMVKNTEYWDNNCCKEQFIGIITEFVYLLKNKSIISTIFVIHFIVLYT
jgi:hypothetical protein